MPIQPSGDVVSRNLSGEEVLLHLGTGVYFGLNETGTRLWHLLLETRDKEMAIARFKQEFDVDDALLRKDVDDLLLKLKDKGLLRIDP